MTVLDTLPLTREERAIFRRRRVLSTARWAECCRYLSSGPAVGRSRTPIRWSNARDPLGVAIMAAFDDDRWRRVIVMGAPQRSSKTELAINFALAMIEQHRAAVFYHHARMETAEQMWKEKIAPALASAPALRGLLPTSRDEMGVSGYRPMTNGGCMFIRGSESRAALAGVTARVTIADDVQSMAAFPEGDHPVDLAMERADAYPEHMRRHLVIGQPGMVDDYLATALFASTFYVPFVPCRKCGTYQMIEWDRMVYDTTDPAAARLDTWMRCANPKCRHEIRDDQLPEMLADGLWVSTPPGENWVRHPPDGGTTIDPDRADVYPATGRRTTSCGFWRSGLYWPFTSWGALAAMAIEAEASPEAKINFAKRVRAVPYRPPKIDEEALEEGDVLAHVCEGHHWGAIPEASGVATGDGCIVVSADIQSGYLWYLVYAWRQQDGSAWLIECGRMGKRLRAAELSRTERMAAVRTGIGVALEKLAAKEAEGWPVVGAGGTLVQRGARARYCLVDCGFQREIVQLACRRYNGGRMRGVWLPVQGAKAQARSGVPVWPKRPRRERATNRLYYDCNTNRAKLYVRTHLAIPAGQPGALHLPPDMPAQCRDWYAKHLCAEEWDAVKGRWVQVAHENHLLDCAAEQLIGAIAAGVHLGWLEGPDHPPAPGQEAPITDWFARSRRMRRGTESRQRT